MAMALSVSTGVNATKAVLPSSKALITPLRRGMSGMLQMLLCLKIRRPIADSIDSDKCESRLGTHEDCEGYEASANNLTPKPFAASHIPYAFVERDDRVLTKRSAYLAA